MRRTLEETDRASFCQCQSLQILHFCNFRSPLEFEVGTLARYYHATTCRRMLAVSRVGTRPQCQSKETLLEELGNVVPRQHPEIPKLSGRKFIKGLPSTSRPQRESFLLFPLSRQFAKCRGEWFQNVSRTKL